jgi:hypothetical protein
MLIETEFENGDVRQHDLGRLSRPAKMICGEGVGLMLEDARAILKRLQTAIVVDQVEEISRTSRACPDCQIQRRIHDYRVRKLDTLFGRITVRAPRVRHCRCEATDHGTTGSPQSILSHVLPDRATPELRRLHADLGSRHSFREAARILDTFLPCVPQSHVTVRNRLGQVAKEMEDECVKPAPVGADDNIGTVGTTLFLDGAHIPSRPEYQKRHLDVLVGKIEGRKGPRHFGMVKEGATSPILLLREELGQAGWRSGDPLTVLTDGEPALPNLVNLAVGRQFTHILDWWHISMRVRHVETAIKGLLQCEGFPRHAMLFQRPVERLRWWIWQGRPRLAVTMLQWLVLDCTHIRTDDPELRSAANRAQSRCQALLSYLSNNIRSLCDYGSRYRRSLPISTSRAEGCADDIANARMGEKRRMRWSPRGAHRVAVTRAAVLDGRLTISHRKLAA